MSLPEEDSSSGISRFCAIDIGTNAMRAVFALDKRGSPYFFNNLRFPIRLGESVFALGELSTDKITLLKDSLFKIREKMDEFDIPLSSTKVVATSAMRNSRNQEEVCQEIKQDVGFEIEVINGNLEANLIASAVNLVFPNKNALIFDIGGGSTELVIKEGTKAQKIQSIPVGTIRMLEDKNSKELERIFSTRLDQFLNGDPPEFLIGTGGNLRRIGKIKTLFFGGSSKSAALHEVIEINHAVALMSRKQRVNNLGLRADRADVIDKALNLVLKIMKKNNFDEILLPRVGLKEGVIQHYFF